MVRSDQPDIHPEQSLMGFIGSDEIRKWSQLLHCDLSALLRALQVYDIARRYFGVCVPDEYFVFAFAARFLDTYTLQFVFTSPTRFSGEVVFEIDPHTGSWSFTVGDDVEMTDDLERTLSLANHELDALYELSRLDSETDDAQGEDSLEGVSYQNLLHPKIERIHEYASRITIDIDKKFSEKYPDWSWIGRQMDDEDRVLNGVQFRSSAIARICSDIKKVLESN